MKKYRLLVTGQNKVVIDDIFMHLSREFDIISCLNRLSDMVRHIDIFKPEIFIICLSDDSKSEIANYVDLKRILTREDIPTVVIGIQEECDAFEKLAPQMADLMLIRPASIDRIRKEIAAFIENVEQEKADREQMLKKLEELKAKNEKKRILVIDDDPLMLRLVKSYLDEKYEVAIAISGKVALKFLETKPTDFILLDYEMPVENGPEVLKKIRANDKLCNVPVVFLTGVTDKAKIYHALQLKPQGYLIKPIDREKLLGTVEKFIG